ncbi:monooxygenase [Longispora fulva]|uniref:3-hydroxy-9,10-secoandrosta-1,3,5(10)-triene-9, 17-dione monooxygenase reductase component n=1 Tax=Longispora fulva TaxID=619741 RepID=A0A8J7GSA4_9ACTN|nr:flavin reductase family protein [Longispora fulva]MBG6137323.1 3-hydroxy-9,10-secoandrosta-1,3,5(10)-triene-9,17-dione monooxygenase reductase component [Longispora fulva]GIG61322.1 monooxygenase [Longispora fulva]
MSAGLTMVPGRTDREFRRVAGRLPTGVTVVAVATDAGPQAMTVNSFTTVSLAPRLVLVCLRRGCRLGPQLTERGAFAVTVLGSHQHRLSAWFADPRRPVGAAAFEGVPWTPAPATGSPVLDGAVGYFDCVVREVRRVGDHDVVTGEVLAFDAAEGGEPLVFVAGGYTRPADLAA